MCSDEIVLLTLFSFSETVVVYWQIIVIDHYITTKKIRAKTSTPLPTQLLDSTKTNMAAGFRGTWRLSTGNAAS